MKIKISILVCVLLFSLYPLSAMKGEEDEGSTPAIGMIPPYKQPTVWVYIHHSDSSIRITNCSQSTDSIDYTDESSWRMGWIRTGIISSKGYFNIEKPHKVVALLDSRLSKAGLETKAQRLEKIKTIHITHKKGFADKADALKKEILKIMGDFPMNIAEERS